MGLHSDKGKVVSALMVAPEDQLFLIADSGVTIRVPVSGISEQGRDATGVRVGDERITARTVLWAAGVRAVPLSSAGNVVGTGRRWTDSYDVWLGKLTP